MKIFFRMIRKNFWRRKLTLKFILRGWLLVLGQKECLVECATVCIKIEVILLQGVPPILSRLGSGFSTQYILHEDPSLRAKILQKNHTLCDFLTSAVKTSNRFFSLFHCYCIPPPGSHWEFCPKFLSNWLNQFM